MSLLHLARVVEEREEQKNKEAGSDLRPGDQRDESLSAAYADGALSRVLGLAEQVRSRRPILAEAIAEVARAKHAARHPDLLDLITTCRRALENQGVTVEQRCPPMADPTDLVNIYNAGAWRGVYYALGPGRRLSAPARELVGQLLRAAATDGRWRQADSSGYALATFGDAALLARQIKDLIEEFGEPV